MADHRDDFIISIRYALLKKGAKQKFSLFFLILLSIIIIALDKSPITSMNFARGVLNDIIYRVSIISSQPAKFIKYSIQLSNNHFNIYKENEDLNYEIEFLRKQKYNNSYLASENDILKKALYFSETKKSNQTFSRIAKVVLDQESPFLKSILLNRGTKHNIKKGMSVFKNDYLLGTIIETNFLSSRVLLLTDLNSKLPVLIEVSGVNAILEGTGNKLDLDLKYLPENYQIEPGKTIFTSGKDGFIEAGIPVAETYLNKKNEVLIKLLGDPDQALIVYVTNGKTDK